MGDLLIAVNYENKIIYVKHILKHDLMLKIQEKLWYFLVFKSRYFLMIDFKQVTLYMKTLKKRI